MTDGTAVPRTWKVRATSVLLGTTLDGSRMPFWPGDYVMTERLDGRYELMLPDLRFVFTPSQISSLQERGQLIVEGSWPGTL